MRAGNDVLSDARTWIKRLPAWLFDTGEGVGFVRAGELAAGDSVVFEAGGDGVGMEGTAGLFVVVLCHGGELLGLKGVSFGWWQLWRVGCGVEADVCACVLCGVMRIED